MPHSHCVLNDPVVITLNVLGGGMIVLAYLLIPVGLIMVTFRVWTRLDSELQSLMLLAAAFVFLCGTTHFLEEWNWWHTSYVLAGIVKMVTGVVSLVFARRLVNYFRRVLSRM